MKGNYTIALLDILGFSKLVEHNSLDQVVEKPLTWFRKSLAHSLLKEGYPSQVPSFEELLSKSRLGVAWFSDTLLFYTLQDTNENLKDLILAVGWLLFETMWLRSTRIRGAIAYGEAYIDQKNSVFVGKPIVEAYRLEQKQNWAGCALAESAFNRIPEGVRDNELEYWWITMYQVPLKDSAPKEMLVVDWTQGIHERGEDFQWSKESTEPSPNEWATIGDVCEKWKNTRQFHRDVCRDCNRSRRHRGIR